MSSTGGPQLCRIAAFGDSLTQGDGWPGPAIPLRHAASEPWLNPDCRMRFASCRGNYPRILQGLVGAEAIVKNFGLTGRAAADLMPQACHPGADGSANATLDTIMREHHHEHRLRNSPTCESELLRTRPFVELAAFEPNIVVLQLGTNDAIHSKFSDRALSTSGTLGFAHSLTRVIFGLWQLTARAPPRVLYLEPPPTMSDNIYAPPRSGSPSCVRMHNCRYHPSLSCWSIAECITCSADDRLDSDRSIKHPTQFYQPHAENVCVRHDALQTIRRASAQITASLSQPAHKHADARARCVSNSTRPEVRFITTSALQPSWRYFSGPYHLSPVGSAYLACTVHNALASTSCGSVPCERLQHAGVGHYGQARALWAQHHNVSIDLVPPLPSPAVAHKFCDAILAGARGEAHLTPSTLDALEASLFEVRGAKTPS